MNITIILAIGGGVLLLGLFVLAMMYNGLIGKKNQVRNAFATVDVQLKKRHDLIPNLIATVKQYMTHEADLLTKVTQMRAQAQRGGMGARERVALENQISHAMGSIMIAVENYPDLKASENFINLQGSLNEVEEQLSAARRAFNAAATDFNDAVEMFPTNMMAKSMGYRRRPLFEIPAAQRENPNVGKLFGGQG
jgi:LemA protein